jgi:hypothetical protein
MRYRRLILSLDVMVVGRTCNYMSEKVHMLSFLPRANCHVFTRTSGVA